jgi:hypothetical protein
MWLAEPKDGHQGLIDTPLLLRAYPAHEFTKPSCIHGADLLNQDTGGFTKQLDLGAERCRLRDVGATSTTERGRSSLA